MTDAQVRRLREKRMEGKTVSAAAAAAGMGERTAHRWQRGALPSAAKAPRTWRTREDLFADVWLSEVVPRLVADAAGRLQALTLFEWLCEQHPGRFEPGQLRTLQRRVRAWRAQHGPDHEVYFEQVAVPGREAAFDFTDARDLGVTIRGVPVPHLLFEWVLSYSGWTYVALALSETFEALVAGVQGALWTLGAAPAVLRHDNLSAATRELRRSGGRQLTVRFRQVLEHYGLRSSRIQPRKAHENGVVEQSHFRTQTAIEQALLLRGVVGIDTTQISWGVEGKGSPHQREAHRQGNGGRDVETPQTAQRQRYVLADQPQAPRDACPGQVEEKRRTQKERRRFDGLVGNQSQQRVDQVETSGDEEHPSPEQP